MAGSAKRIPQLGDPERGLKMSLGDGSTHQIESGLKQYEGIHANASLPSSSWTSTEYLERDPTLTQYSLINFSLTIPA
jgi:hypothetical protein